LLHTFSPGKLSWHLLPGNDFGVKKVYKSPKSIHRADAKGLTSSSKLSVSCVLTLQTLPLITFTPSLCLYRQLVSIHPLGSKLPVETKGCNLVTRLTHVGSWFTFMGQSSAANYFLSTPFGRYTWSRPCNKDPDDSMERPPGV